MTDIGMHIRDIAADINARLPALIDGLCDEGILRDAMSYSLLSGGKRMRPVLCMMTADMLGDSAYVRDIACAIEMIHAYSLIHDDLPAMDDDDVRRGKPTNHVVFGEAMAILAGDGLLNCAFEVMMQCAQQNRESGLDYLGAMNVVAQAAGTRGMIAGQAGDIMFEGHEPDPDVLEYIHQHKTAAMIKAPVMAAAVLYGASDEERSALETYGACIGLVFQIIDDILDETGDPDKVGKTLGKDAEAGKQTFTSVYGVENARRIARAETDDAIKALRIFGNRADHLVQFASYLLERDR